MRRRIIFTVVVRASHENRSSWSDEAVGAVLTGLDTLAQAARYARQVAKGIVDETLVALERGFTIVGRVLEVGRPPRHKLVRQADSVTGVARL